MSGGGGSQMTAGGKPHHADFVWQHAKLLCTRAHDANRALRIAKLDRMVIARSQSVSHNKCRKAHGVKPIGDLAAFMICGEIFVASAGENNYRRSGRALRRSSVQGDRWPVGIGGTERARSLALPQLHGSRLCRGILMRWRGSGSMNRFLRSERNATKKKCRHIEMFHVVCSD